MDFLRFLGFALGGFFGIVLFFGGLFANDVLSFLIGFLLLLIAVICYRGAGKRTLL